MIKNDIVLKEEQLVHEKMVMESELPLIITGQVKKMNELSKSIDDAFEAASKAKELAELAKSKSAGAFKKKGAIEGLQDASVDLAKAVQKGAEAQKLSFEFQKKLADISKYLFSLGVSNIARNRCVVREIQLSMKGASRQELSALARQEMELVVKQLKEQEDIMHKQQVMNNKVKAHDDTLKIHSLETKEQLRLIKEQEEIDKFHTEQIKMQEETDKLLEKKIKIQDEVDKIHENQIKLQEETDKIHNEKIETLENKVRKLENQVIEKANIKLVTISMLAGVSGLVISLVNIFL